MRHPALSENITNTMYPMHATNSVGKWGMNKTTRRWAGCGYKRQLILLRPLNLAFFWLLSLLSSVCSGLQSGGSVPRTNMKLATKMWNHNSYLEDTRDVSRCRNLCCDAGHELNWLELLNFTCSFSHSRMCKREVEKQEESGGRSRL